MKDLARRAAPLSTICCRRPPDVQPHLAPLARLRDLRLAHRHAGRTARKTCQFRAATRRNNAFSLVYAPATMPFGYHAGRIPLRDVAERGFRPAGTRGTSGWRYP